MRLTRAMILIALSAVLLTARPAAAQYAFEWIPEQQAAVAEVFELVSLHSYLTNTGTTTDDYLVEITREVDDLVWSASVCYGEICYPPFTTEFMVENLGPGEFAELMVDFTPVTDGVGHATVTLTVTSQGEPGLQQSFTFRCIRGDVGFVLVADDEGAGLQSYYESAASDLGLTYGTWDAALLNGTPRYRDLIKAERVLWLTGENGSLDDDERIAVDQFLGGGRCGALSGAGVAAQNTDEDWLIRNFGAFFVGELPGSPSVTGVAGNPVGDGLELEITGGDGAGTNGSPDQLGISGNGQAAFEYVENVVAGATLREVHFRSVLLGFGLEGIASASERASLMSAIYDWFAAVTPVDDRTPQALFASAPEASPNPFNPRTVIAFDIGGSDAADLSVDVFDLAGRRVRTLFTGRVDPGPQSLTWDGRSDSGRPQAAGIYLARIRVNAESRQIKMTLAK